MKRERTVNIVKSLAPLLCTLKILVLSNCQQIQMIFSRTQRALYKLGEGSIISDVGPVYMKESQEKLSRKTTPKNAYCCLASLPLQSHSHCIGSLR